MKDEHYLITNIKMSLITMEPLIERIDNIDSINSEKASEIIDHFVRCVDDLIYLFGVSEINEREEEIFTEDLKKRIEEL